MDSLLQLDATFALRLTSALLHVLWQGCLIAALTMAGAALLRRAPAQSRYLLHVASLLLMMLCLPLNFVLTQPPGAAAPELHVTEEPQGGPSISTTARPASDVRVPRTEHSVARRSESQATITTSPWFAWAAPYLSAGYFACVAFMLARLARGLWGGHCLRQSSQLAHDAALLQLVEQQAHRLGLRTKPAIAWCQKISVPVVIGVLRPIILLPAALLSGLTTQQLQAIVTHELAHIRRHDLLLNLVQRFAEAVLFFHPAVWLISRRADGERELATDDLVLSAGWKRATYADALVRMAELSLAMQSQRVAAGMTALAASGNTGRSELSYRVLRILHSDDSMPLRLTPGGVALCGAAWLLLLCSPIAVHVLAQRPDDPAETVVLATSDSETLPAGTNSAGGVSGVTERSGTAQPANANEAQDAAFDKSQLAKVSPDFTSSTRIRGNTASGAGVIERIEQQNKLILRSGDRLDLDQNTEITLRRRRNQPSRQLDPTILEAGIAVSFTISNGRLETLQVVGIAELPADYLAALQQIELLKLRLGNSTSTSLDGRFPMRITGKGGEVMIRKGETKLIELPSAATEVQWQVGEYLPEFVDDIEPFHYLLVQWRSNGQVTWTCYQADENR